MLRTKLFSLIAALAVAVAGTVAVPAALGIAQASAAPTNPTPNGLILCC
jgi:hypothetical protein